MGFNFVYWIHLDGQDINKDGYVGVSANPNKRILQHKRRKDNDKLSNFLINNEGFYILDIVYTGDREECFLIENKLRPKKNIGLNKTIGGKHPSIGAHTGFKHSDSTKAMMSIKKEKKVLCMDLNIKFNSIKEAKEILGLYLKISEVCNGKRKTTGGMKFKFIEENQNV